MKKKEKRPTKSQALLLEKIKSSNGVAVSQSSEGKSHFYLPSGPPVSDDSVTRLIKNGWLIPANDGLTPNITQTYKINYECINQNP